MGLFSSIGKIAKGVLGFATGGIGSTLLSGGLDLVGSVLQNNSAKGIAAQNNMTQIELANTAHQRQVKDLEAAGLNPILSGTGGLGAASPQMQAAPVQNILKGVVNSALDARQTLANTRLTKQQEAVSAATEANVHEDTQKKVSEYWANVQNAQTQKALERLHDANAATARQTARSARVQADLDEDGAKVLQSLETAGRAGSSAVQILKAVKGATK